MAIEQMVACDSQDDYEDFLFHRAWLKASSFAWQVLLKVSNFLQAVRFRWINQFLLVPYQMKQITHHYDSLSYIPFFLGGVLGMDPSDEQQGFHVMPNMTSCLLGGFNIIINPGSPGDEHKLLGGFNPSEKYESQLFTLFPIYGKIIQMFQTTNQ